jgi:hypothetical protein
MRVVFNKETLRYHFKSIFMTLAFAASLHTTSAATANTTVLVETEGNIDDLVYAITFNGQDEIDFLTQTSVFEQGALVALARASPHRQDKVACRL